MPNGTINPTAWTDPTINAGVTPIRKVHIDELRAAIDRLVTYAPNVTNCGFNNYCQTCQSCQSCQTCQTQCRPR